MSGSHAKHVYMPAVSTLHLRLFLFLTKICPSL